jgi:tetratricopeptide (TPR) repeat protein
MTEVASPPAVLGSVGDSQRPSGSYAHHMPPATTSTASQPPSVFAFCAKYFCCVECKSFLDDPVCLLPEDRGFACRACAAVRHQYSELPPSFATAMAELRALQRQHGDTSDAAPRRVVRGKRPVKVGEMFPSPAKMVDPAVASSGVFVHIVQSNLPPSVASSEINAGAPLPSEQPAVVPAMLFQGTSINPNVEPAKIVTPAKGAAPAPNHFVLSPGASAVGLSLDARRELEKLQSSESNERSQLDSDEAMDFLELGKKRAQHLRVVQMRRPGSSKKLKLDGDEKYEKAEYAASVELYTRAILAQPSDLLTKLHVLYGNRSAAFFMAGRYTECIEDCMRVTATEPENTKMFHRAAKAATALGDLAEALTILSMAKAPGAQEQLDADKRRLTQGCELLARAKELFGLPEGDNYWQMLVSQFAECRIFRMRFSESLARQGRFDHAAEALSPIMGMNRTPDIALSMAKNWFYAGFESLEKARLTLQEFPGSEECVQLLKLITTVHEAKERGNSLFSSKDFAGSVEQYTLAIDADPKNNKILRILYCNRAAAHKEIGRYREGIEDCTKAIKLDPKFSKAYARRARCHLHLNDFASAIRDFRRAIELDQSDHELVRELNNAENLQRNEAEKEKDLYYILGLPRSTTEAEIKKRYRELSLKWHPDKWVTQSEEDKTQAERKFKLVCEAHTTLIDPKRRKEYDIKYERDQFVRTSSAGAFRSNFPTASSSDAFFTRHNGGRQPGQRPPTGNFW